MARPIIRDGTTLVWLALSVAGCWVLPLLASLLWLLTALKGKILQTDSHTRSPSEIYYSHILLPEGARMSPRWTESSLLCAFVVKPSPLLRSLLRQRLFSPWLRISAKEDFLVSIYVHLTELLQIRWHTELTAEASTSMKKLTTSFGVKPITKRDGSTVKSLIELHFTLLRLLYSVAKIYYCVRYFLGLGMVNQGVLHGIESTGILIFYRWRYTYHRVLLAKADNLRDQRQRCKSLRIWCNLIICFTSKLDQKVWKHHWVFTVKVMGPRWVYNSFLIKSLTGTFFYGTFMDRCLAACSGNTT